MRVDNQIVMDDIQEQRLLLLECVEHLARKLAISHLQMATTTGRRQYADKYWRDYVPSKYKFLLKNE